MSKQSFTTGQVLTAAQVNSLQANDFNQTVSVKTASYTLAAADKGTRIEFNTSASVTCTVNSGLFDAGDTLVIQNRGAGVVTVTAGTATVNTSATLALSQYDAGTLYFISASASIFFNTDAGGGSPLTTKGDLYGFSTVDARIPIGANNTVLTADSNESLGLKWAAPSAGALTLITKSTFSATASHSINNCFSATYDNYLLLWKLRGSTTDQLAMRLRLSGTDATAANYYDAGYFANYAGTSSGNHYDNAAVAFFLGGKPTADTFYNMAMHIYSPAKAESTTFNATANRAVSGVGAGFFISGTHQVSTAYDGFTLIADSAGTITGEAIVYGYQIS